VYQISRQSDNLFPLYGNFHTEEEEKKNIEFSIYRGVFQGDTLSPLLFNLAINPLLAYLSTSEDCGYSAQVHAANSIGLPPVDTPIYVLWTDSSDDAPTGWYRAKVISYHCDGSCDLAYDNGDSEQSLNLYTAEWCYAGRYRKAYHPVKPSTKPSTSISGAAALPKICYSSLHKAKGFADNLTVSYFQRYQVTPACFIITSLKGE